MKIGVILKRDSIAALNVLDRFYLDFRGKIELYLDSEIASAFPDTDDIHFIPEQEMPATVELLLVLGGDGTFLHGASLIQQEDVPVLGINLGYLGFLTETPIEAFYPIMDHILAGNYSCSDRHRLKITLTKTDGSMLTRNLLNDAVFNSGKIARIINLELLANDKPVTTYRADGLIFATPTGSTAYALSAGGPILHPALNLMLIAPICPHTLTMRPLVLPAEMPLSVKVKGDRSEVYLTLDGQDAILIDDTIEAITIVKSDHPIKMITPQKCDYFKILRNKLKWSGAPLD